MPDSNTQAQVTQTIILDTSQATGSAIALTTDVDKTAASFSAMGVAAKKADTTIIEGSQAAATATSTMANSSTAAVNKLKEAHEGLLSSTHKQKLAFEDVGKAALGENFGLRQVAMNFGLIGPAATLAIVAVFEISKALFEQYEKKNQAALAAKSYIEVMGKAAEKVAEVDINVHKMALEFEEAKTNVNLKKEALDQYNKTFGDTLGKAKSYNEAERIFISKSAAYQQGMEQRAIADAAYGLEKDELTKKIKSQAENEIGFWGTIKTAYKSITGSIGDVAIAAGKANEDLLSEEQKQADAFTAIGDKASKAANAIFKAAGIEPGKELKVKADEALKELKAYLAESQKISEDARNKELTDEDIKFKKIKEDLIKEHRSTELLEEQHRKNIVGINKKFDDEDAKKISGIQKKQKEEAAKKEEEFNSEFLKEQADFIKKSEQQDEDKFKKELQDATTEYKKLLDAAMMHGKDTYAIQLAYDNQIAAIKKQQAAQEIVDTKKKNDEAVKENKDANDKIISNQKLTNSQKLKLIKEELDALEHANKVKGILSDMESEKQKDDLEAYKKIQEAKLQVQKDAANAIAGILNSASDLLGKNTAAGKAVAIAGATITAIQGAMNAYTSMSKIPVVGPALGIAAAAAALAAGAANIKKIEEVKVPGQGGSTGSAANLGTASQPAPTIAPVSNTTNLSSSSVNQLKSHNDPQPVKAVVVESDITNSQSRLSSFRRGATI